MLKLDELDLALIGLLERDGRMSYAALAQEVGLTSTAVRQRIQKLMDQQVISGFQANLDYQKLGYPIQAIINLNLNFARTEAFYSILPTLEEVQFCYRITGEDCMMMRVNFRDNLHLLDFINRVSKYGTSKTFVILEQVV